MKYFYRLLILLIPTISLFTFFIAPAPAHAQFKSWCEIIGGNCDNPTGAPETDIKTREDLSNRIKIITQFIFGIIVVVFIGLMLYGTFVIVTSMDNQEKKQSGIKILRNGVIGFVGTFLLFLLVGLMIGILGLGNVFTLPNAILSE